MPWGCTECGGENVDGTRFCGHCGARGASTGKSATTSVSAADLQSSVADVVGLVSSDVALRSRVNEDGRDGINRPLAERLADSRVSAEERRLVTALFADVSGFTALAHGLEAEQLLDIIGPIVSHLAEIVARYGGYVGKFAGDAILAFFGAPVSHEDDAARALLAARDMQREMADVLAGLGPEAQQLTLHVGVNTGYVIAGSFGAEARMEYSVLGDAVNVAQRLEAAAPPGAVYVGHETYQLTSSRFVFEDIGELTVKGKPEPVQCWRLIAELGTEDRLRPAVARNRIVGRSRELGAVTGVLAALRSGAGGVVAIVGEPGVGKSALLSEARRSEPARGTTWVETHCVAYRSRPYRPYVELFRVLLDIREDVEPDTGAALLVSHAQRAGVPNMAPFVLRLLGLPIPADVPDTTPADPLAFRHGLHEAIADYLTAIASTHPLVIGIEDVHWADQSTAELTRLLAARSRVAPFSLVVTARPEGRPVLETIAAENERSAFVDLGPLDRDGVQEMSEDLLRGPVSSSLVAVVTERTSGNPLFAQQLLLSLVDTQAAQQGSEGWRLPSGWDADAVPVAVEQVLAARIDLLPRRAADLLHIASVIGRDVPPALLRRLSLQAGSEHDQSVDLLVRGGFLDPVVSGSETRLYFHHALLVEVAYGRLLKARRRTIHRQVVQAALELYGASDDVVDMLARHAYRGEMGMEALGFLSRAAARAASLFANEQAATYLRNAVAIAEADPGSHAELPDLLLRLAQIEELTGAYESALRLYERVRAATDDVRATLGMASALRVLGENARSLDLLREVRSERHRLSASHSAALAVIEGRVLSTMGAMNEGIAVLQEGFEAVRGSGSTWEGELLVTLARAEEAVGAYPEAAAHIDAARALFESQGDLPRLATALRVMGGVLHDAAEPNDASSTVRAREVLERALELSRRVGSAEEVGASLMNLGRTLMDLGSHEEAIRCVRESIGVFEAAGNRVGVTAGYCNLSEKLLELDRVDEAEDAARRGHAVSQTIPNTVWTPHTLHCLAFVARRRGDDAEAARLLEEAARGYARNRSTSSARHCFTAAAEARERLGESDAAAECRRQAAELEEKPVHGAAETRVRRS